MSILPQQHNNRFLNNNNIEIRWQSHIRCRSSHDVWERKRVIRWATASSRNSSSNNSSNSSSSSTTTIATTRKATPISNHDDEILSIEPPSRRSISGINWKAAVASASASAAGQVVTISPGRPHVDDDPSRLQSTWSHRAWVASGCTTVLIFLTKAAVVLVAAGGGGGGDLVLQMQTMLAGYLGYILADLGSGIYHWGIDNYGDASTPVFGSQIEAFQGHHKWPCTITRRQFCNNLHGLARAVTLVLLPLHLIINIAAAASSGPGPGPVLHGFIGMFSGCIMLSQQFHAWAHSPKTKLPPLVVALQDAGFLVSRSHHAAHHRPPYNNNYCIVSGAWNHLLDTHRFFEALEMLLFFQLGVRPRSWIQLPHSDVRL